MSDDARRPRRGRQSCGNPHGLARGGLVAVLVLLAGAGALLAWRWSSGGVADDPAFERIERSEAVILHLSAGDLGRLGKSILNLRFPDSHSLPLFEETVTANALLDAEPAVVEAVDTANVRLREWPVAEEAAGAPAGELRPWAPFLDRLALVHNGGFKIVRGEFLDEDEGLFGADVAFHGLAETPAGELLSADAHLRVVWSRVDGQGESVWRIRDWITRDFHTLEREGPVFRDVLDRVIPDPETRRRARTSLHEELVIRSFLDEDFKPPVPGFSRMAFDRHPAVSVVDIDRDGFDDLYVMARWGRNLLLRNRGDGTFEDIAPRVGLDIDGHTSCAIFADFDNDGDPDAFLGRTFERTMYLVNDGGRFVDRSADLVGLPLPYLAGSMSAVDYDRDGLLDVYVATYAAEMLARYLQRVSFPRRIANSLFGGEAIPRFLSEQDARKLLDLLLSPEANRVSHWPGPPNLLLHNAGGGRFERAADADPVQVWWNTWQATWADFDGDGDQDVLIANDFAPNNLIRNDGGGRFTDITGETGTADLGFGMGVSWGDYDNDGRQDLYVTNMFSKAGRRITAQVDASIRDRFAPMARGNSLFQNLPDRFERVSGLEPPALMVEKAGWGWGGQFLDLDSDGYLDIHAPCGFYSAPDVVAIAEDT